jgi:release factor glutamine methyltransferase
MTVREALKYTTHLLAPISDEAATEARIIVSHLAKVQPNKLPLFFGEIEKDEILKIAEKRKQGTPLQYILGKWWFYKSEFFVGRGVLIPRQDTELLVETGLELVKDKPDADICDLCSGSGCVAISLAKELPQSKVCAVEKFDDAYDYLVKNTEYNGAKNLTPVKADVCDAPFGKYDLIVCNPPYIPNSDKEILSAEVLNEPHTALFGGEDGLYFYRVISSLWKTALKKGGHLAFEVGIKEADAVAEILKQEGFANISSKTDLLGIQRVVFGTASDVIYNCN